MTWMSTDRKFSLSCPAAEQPSVKFVSLQPFPLINLKAPKIWVSDNLGGTYNDVLQQQRLAPIEILYDERHLERLFEADDVNSQYVQSVVCEEYEKNMHEAILQKVIMNGSVVSLLDKPKHDQIRERVEKLHKVFYQGDELTNFELDIERMYVNEKYEKVAAYSKRKSLRYKVRWTISDLNKHQD